MKVEYIFNKVRDNIRKYGFVNFLKRASIKIFHILNSSINNILNKKAYKERLNKIINNKKYTNIIVFYPFFDFNMPNFQRFQQLAIALGNTENTLFFYCTPNNIYDNICGFKNIENDLYVTNQYKLLIEHDIKNRVMFFVSTDLKFNINDIYEAKKRKDKIIYDYVDEIHYDIVGEISKELMLKHESIMNDEEIFALTTSEKLYNDAIQYRTKNISLVTNGVKIEDFKINEEYISEKFKKLKEFKKDKDIVLCYYGAFASWFDFELIKYISKNKKIGIVLIGIDYDKSLVKSKITDLENVIFLGCIEYKNLKYYANEADILTIPFLVNDITNATSPVKLFEYMALQKPIITTDMEECRKYKSVNIAKNYDDFLEKTYKIKQDLENGILDKAILFEEALENSWENKAKEIVKMLSK